MPVAGSFTSTSRPVATGFSVSRVMLTGLLTVDSSKIPAGRRESCAATLAVTVPVVGNTPSVKPSSAGVTVTLDVPAGISLVIDLSPTVTVTLVACGSISVTVIAVGFPPSSSKLFVTVGVLGRATIVTASFVTLLFPSFAAKI